LGALKVTLAPEEVERISAAVPAGTAAGQSYPAAAMKSVYLLSPSIFEARAAKTPSSPGGSAGSSAHPLRHLAGSGRGASLDCRSLTARGRAARHNRLMAAKAMGPIWPYSQPETEVSNAFATPTPTTP